MPAKSQQQLKYIYAMRNKYSDKKRIPKNMKWIFNKEWTDGVKMKSLPKHVENESIMTFDEFNQTLKL
jgi:hypothetical protein